MPFLRFISKNSSLLRLLERLFPAVERLENRFRALPYFLMMKTIFFLMGYHVENAQYSPQSIFSHDENVPKMIKSCYESILTMIYVNENCAKQPGNSKRDFRTMNYVNENYEKLLRIMVPNLPALNDLSREK